MAGPGQVHARALPQGALNVLLIGSGAREHAMALALRRSQRCHLFVVMKHRNPGLAKSATGFKILDDRDAAGIVQWARQQKIHLAVTGPESSLEAGVTDALRAAGIAVASPSQSAARIETSKTFMRQLMERHDVPGRLGYHPFNDMQGALDFIDSEGPEWAIKPVGLTGGKGVQVHGDHFADADGAKAYVRAIFANRQGGGALQFEELARGEEFTVMAFTDGATVLPMPTVQDHKRLLEGDEGPNTGGMGSYSQADGLLPFLSKADYDASVHILQGLVDALRADGTPYVGTIYGQFMLTAAGPKVIEVNARFGDPEAMNVLQLLETDYLALLEAMATGTLAGHNARFRHAATVVKYVVPRGYGESGGAEGGHPVQVDEFNIKRAHGAVFLGALEQQMSGPLVTLASRTLAVLGEGATIEEANQVCEASLRHVHGEGLHVRHDIGSASLIQRRVEHMAALRARKGPQGAAAGPKGQQLGSTMGIKRSA
jgi:phosphoribosylamine--glycine ligase